MLGYRGILAADQGIAGTALTASTTQTSLLHSQSRWNMPANFIGQQTQGQGAKFYFKLGGPISTVVTTPGTLTFAWKIGSVAVFTSQAMALNIVAQTNVTWTYEGIMTLVTLGSGVASTFKTLAVFESIASILGTADATGPGAGQHFTPATLPGAVGTVFDVGVAAAWDFFATWSINNANSIQVTESVLESLN